MSKRPLLQIECISLIVTMAALFYSLPWWSPIALLALTLLCCLSLSHKRMLPAALIGIAASLSCVCALGWEQRANAQLQWAGTTQEAQGLILSSQPRPGGTRYEVLCKLDSVTARVPLMCWDQEQIEAGHTFEGVVSFERETLPYNEGKGIVLRGTAPKLRDLGEGKGIRPFFLRIRRRLLSRMDLLFHGTGRELLKGILFGEKAELSQEVQDVFRKSGAFHILTVSGFHISTIGGGFYLLLKQMRQNQRLTAFLVLPFLLLLAGIEGGEVPALRAAIMGGMFYLSKVVRRDYDPLTAWSAAVITVLLHPYYVKNAGFWMSYGATLGIILFAPLLSNELWRILAIHKDRRKRWMEQVVMLICASAATQIFLIPLQLMFFGGFSWITVLSSLVMFPLMLPIFLLTAGALLLFGVFQPMAVILARAAQLLCGVIYWILRQLSSLDPMLYGQKEWVLLWFLLLYGVFVVLYAVRAKRRMVFHALFACASIFCGTFLLTLPAKSKPVYLFDCNSTLILIREEKAAIVGSLRSPWDVQEAEQILNGFGVKDVELLCLTASRGESSAAADFAKRWDVRCIAAQEETDALALRQIPYVLLTDKEGIRFWETWEIKLPKDRDDAMILSSKEKKFLKLQQKYAIMTEMEPGYSAVFGEDHLTFGQDDLRWKKTWFGALMACIEE